MNTERYCSSCYNGFRVAEQAVAMGCGHLLCFRCFGHNNVESTRVCPIEGCGHDLTKPGELREVTVESEIGHDRLVLAGYRPDQAVEALLRSFQVSQQQQRDFLEKMITNERQRNKRLRAQCEKKLTDVHTGYKNAKKKYEQERTSRQALEGALKELRDKYNEKAHESSALREKSAMQEQENDALRRQNKELQRAHQNVHRSLKQLCRDYNIPANSIPALQTPSINNAPPPKNSANPGSTGNLHLMNIGPPANPNVMGHVNDHRSHGVDSQTPLQPSFGPFPGPMSNKMVYDPHSLPVVHADEAPLASTGISVPFQTPGPPTAMGHLKSAKHQHDSLVLFSRNNQGINVPPNVNQPYGFNNPNALASSHPSPRGVGRHGHESTFRQGPNGGVYGLNRQDVMHTRIPRQASISRLTPQRTSGGGQMFSTGLGSPQLGSHLSLTSR